MRERLGLRIGWMIGAVTGICLAAASIAAGEESSGAEAELGKSAAAESETSADATVSAQIDQLIKQVDQDVRTGLKLLVRGRGVQAKRPIDTANGNAGAKAKRKMDLNEWVGDVEAARSDLKDHQGRLDAVSDQVKSIRKREMTDEEAARLIQLELGIHRVVSALQRGVRELDLAWRRGTDALRQHKG